MRVKVKLQYSETVSYGELVGLWTDTHESVQAVVRLDGHGLMLQVVHPSKVKPAEDEK